MRKRTVLLLAVSQMSLAAAAHAEQGTDAPTGQQAARVDTTEIVVTARRRAETLRGHSTKAFAYSRMSRSSATPFPEISMKILDSRRGLATVRTRAA